MNALSCAHVAMQKKIVSFCLDKTRQRIMVHFRNEKHWQLTKLDLVRKLRKKRRKIPAQQMVWCQVIQITYSIWSFRNVSLTPECRWEQKVRNNRPLNNIWDDRCSTTIVTLESCTKIQKKKNQTSSVIPFQSDKITVV